MRQAGWWLVLVLAVPGGLVGVLACAAVGACGLMAVGVGYGLVLAGRWLVLGACAGLRALGAAGHTIRRVGAREAGSSRPVARAAEDPAARAAAPQAAVPSRVTHTGSGHHAIH